MKIKIFIIAIMIACLGLVTTSYAARSLIGKEDIHGWDGVSGDTSYTRTSSGGYSLTLHDITWVGVDVFHEYGASVNQNSTTLQAALTAVGTSHNVAFWMAPGDWDITAGVTIPSNVALIVPMGTYLKTTSGVTITVEGPFIAGKYHMFTGSSGVSLPNVDKAYPEWWGATNAASDQSTALNNCLTASDHVVFSQTYQISSAISFNKDDGIIEFIDGAKIYVIANGYAAGGTHMFTIASDDNKIYNLYIDGNKANQTGKGMGLTITGNGCHLYSPHIKNAPTIAGSWGDGIYVQNDAAGTRIHSPYVHDNGRNGIAVVDAVDTIITDIRSSGNGHAAVDAESSTGEVVENISVLGGYSSGDAYGLIGIGSAAVAAISTGTADTDTFEQLVNTSGTFSTDSVLAGMLVYNSTDDVFAFVISVDSENQLTLDWDAFPDGNEDYEIYSIPIRGVKFKDVSIDSTTGNSIIIRSAWDVEVDGCTVKSPGLHGIFLETSTTYRYIGDARITSNYVYDCSYVTGNGIYATGTSGASYFIRELIITDNNISGSSHYGIYAAYTKRAIVNNNNIKNCVDASIVLSEVINSVVSGNVVDTSATTPIIHSGTTTYTQIVNNAGSNETVTVTRDLQTFGVSNLDTSSSAVTGYLVSGLYVGEMKTIVMTDATDEGWIEVLNHQDSVPEIGYFDIVGDIWVLMWDGTNWMNVCASGVTGITE